MRTLVRVADIWKLDWSGRIHAQAHLYGCWQRSWFLTKWGSPQCQMAPCFFQKEGGTVRKTEAAPFFMTYFIKDIPLLCHFIFVTGADQQWYSVGEDYRNYEYKEGSGSVGDVLRLATTIPDKIFTTVHLETDWNVFLKTLFYSICFSIYMINNLKVYYRCKANVWIFTGTYIYCIFMCMCVCVCCMLFSLSLCSFLFLWFTKRKRKFLLYKFLHLSRKS